MEPESRKKKWALTERQQVLLKEEIFVAFEKRDEKDGDKTTGKRAYLSPFSEHKKLMRVKSNKILWKQEGLQPRKKVWQQILLREGAFVAIEKRGGNKSC